MSTIVSMRSMQLGDLARVMVIERECFTMPWAESAYITELSNRSAYYIVAETGGEIVGFAGMWMIMDEAHITTLGVAKSHRGRKIGEQLLIGLLEESMARGGRRATLEVRVSNTVAQALYKKYEFESVAIRKKYYQDNDEDAFIMWINDMHDERWLKKFDEFKSEFRAGGSEETVVQE